MFLKMNILVVGGAGYIGAHVVLELLDLNHNVVVFDNFSTGQLLNVDKRAVIINGDISSKSKLDYTFRNHRFDADAFCTKSCRRINDKSNYIFKSKYSWFIKYY